MKPLKILLISLALLPLSAAFAGPNKEAAPQDKGGVVFYGNMTGIEAVMDAFSWKFHIEGMYTRVSSSKFLSTVLTGIAEGRIAADVFQAPLPVLQDFKRKGLLAPSPSPWPQWTENDDVIRLFGIECVALIYNREQVRPEDAPKRYEDLATPRWRNRIVMPDPCSHDTTLSWLVGLREHLFNSDAAWMAFLKGLAHNDPMFVSSFGATPRSIETGEKWIGISLPKYIVTRSPAVLDWAPRGQPLFGTSRGIAVAASAPHPDRARLFVNFWDSEEAMRLLASKTGEYVLIPGVFPPIEGMNKASVSPLRELSSDEISHWRSVFHRIFRPLRSGAK